MSLVRYAVAAVLSTAAAGAYAANAIPNAYDMNNYTAAGYTNTFVSGSTAVDQAITNVLAGGTSGGTTLGLCATTTATVNGVATTISTLSVYYVNGDSAHPLASTTSAFTNRVFTCLANPATTGLASGTKIAVFKESTVGSANGVQPLVNASQNAATTLNFINGTTFKGQAPDTACTSNQLNAGNPPVVLPYNEYFACPATSVPTTGTDIPTGGVADVEARMLLTPSGGAINSQLVSANLSVNPGLDVVWGVPVTTGLYRALQTAEGLTGSCPGGNLDSPTCAPSLSKQQVASLYSGAISTWDQLGLTNTVDQNVYVCRRDIGSGTEASFEAYFLGARCGKSDLPMLGEDANQTWANPSTGRVLSCMQAFDKGGSVTAFYVTSGGAPVTKSFPGGGRWAIGIASTEVKPSQLSGAGDSLRMIAVDGVLPTLANTINGSWPYFSTDALYTVKAGKPNAPTGGALTVFNKIQSLLGHPTFTTANDTTFANVWGTGGDLAPASIYAGTNAPNGGVLPVTTSQAVATPVNVWDKNFTGLGINNCDTAVLTPGITAAPQSKLLGTGSVNN